MSKGVRYSIIGVLIILMVVIRLNEHRLFYDPLLYFFKNSHIDLTKIDLSKHLVSVSVRYWLNAVLSTGIIYVLFNKKQYIKISGIVFFIAWIIFLPVYALFIETDFEYSLMVGFYIRRFLIQPIIGIILILALFYVEKIKK